MDAFGTKFRVYLSLLGFNMEVVEKLALSPKICPKMLQTANEGLLKFGRISIPYLIRKLKCSESMAKDIIDHLNG